MKRIQIRVSGTKIIIREKNTARLWEIERGESWKQQVESFFKEEDILGRIELFLGEEYFKSRRIILENGESIKERIEEERQDDIDRRVWRWIKLDKESSKGYLMISISERTMDEIKEFFHGKGHRIIFLAPEFLKDRNVNFIKLQNIRVYIALGLIVLEMVAYGYFSYREKKENGRLMGYRGECLETKEKLEKRVEELKKKEEEKVDIPKEREGSKIEIILSIIKELPEGIYLESWEFQKNILKLKGKGGAEMLYELEGYISGKRGIKWSEVEYMKRSEKGYLFSLEIYF